MSTTAKGRAGGVLPVNVATRKSASVPSAARGTARTPAPRLRLIIRRLPPGLTETEFWTALGEDWRVGAGKVEWAAYKEGKVSKDPSKPSRPSRAYLKVKEQSLLDTLSATLRTTSFQDAKNTSKDPCLLGPPSLEFAPYNKIPSSKVRNDGRQGTIDQDQEFIDFLQSLTEPITKPPANGAESLEQRSDKVTTTPLLQFIKEKKANKAKEASQAKAAKARQESKDAKASKSEPRSTVIVKSSSSQAEKARVAKATQETVKAINKSVAAMQGKQAPAKADVKTSAKDATPQQTPPKREQERGNASAAARMLQRDLGLVTKDSKSPRIQKAVAASSAADTGASAKSASTAVKTATEATVEQKRPTTPATPTLPTGPRSSRAPSTASTKATAAPTPRSAKPAPQPSAGAKSAFLKHANPSQGVTEELLQAAFEGFGTITRCEIDKKKGLGYIDFSETEGLRKAMQASPVKVGNGQVVVLENRAPHGKRSQAQTQASPAPGNTTSSTTTSASPSPATALGTDTSTSQVSANVVDSAAPASPPATASTATPPTAPRGTTRAGGNAGRAGRGNFGGAARGNFGGSNRGGRGGLRGGGGRGTSGSRGGRGGGANATPAAGGASQGAE